MSAKTKAMTLIVVCQVACMSLWFSGSAAALSLIVSGELSGQRASMLTGAVQLGFVCGTLISAVLGLADRLDPRRFFGWSAILGGSANALIIFTGFDHPWTPTLRFVTGLAMAGVYPVGMKMAAAWADRNMGLMVGVLVGALTLGSALPHLFSSFGGLDWRITIAAASACAFLSAGMIFFVELGPRHAQGQRFDPRAVISMLRRPAILLANAGYLGHMWELYAMWAWLGAFLTWVSQLSGDRGPDALVGPTLLTFCVIAAGAIGCILAGALADRLGRTTVTIGAMAISGICAATIGLVAEWGMVAVAVVALIWGVTVVADSAQFSASIVELAEPSMVGTALTVQTSLGFLLTFFSIQAMPVAVDALTWRYAFVTLAIGPFLGVLAMWILRMRPEAARLSNGRR
jgi:MFS family permease